MDINKDIKLDEFSSDNKKDVEIWETIPGYENRYKISNLGNVWSIYHERKMKQCKKGNYYTVKFFDDNGNMKIIYVHKLVAQTFVVDNDPNNIPRVVDHIDNNGENNRADNLRWVTKSFNSQVYHDNFKKQRIIIQYDLKGAIIREWNGIKEIIEHNPTYNRNSIRRYISKKEHLYGYNWQYKYDKPEQDTKLHEDEIFKNIGIFKGHDFSIYEVSNYGKVRHIDRQYKYLRQALQDTGYYKVILFNKNKKKINIKIHQIVAHAFVPILDKKVDRVNHIDENKLNNYYKNLEWVTARGNAIHSLGKQVHQLDINTKEIIKTFISISDAQKAINSNNSMGIIRCCKGTRQTYYGYRWCYA